MQDGFSFQAGAGGTALSFALFLRDMMRERGIKRAGPYRVTQIMASNVSACVATPLKIKGVNYSIASACATSAHCIGHAVELIQMNKQAGRRCRRHALVDGRHVRRDGRADLKIQ